MAVYFCGVNIIKLKDKWKDVEGYEGIYQVSDLGNVRSLDRQEWNGSGYWLHKGKLLCPWKTKSGYLQVSLSKNGHLKRCYVHRLVAQAFLQNPLNLPQVNHKDESPNNNRVNNLEWCSSLYNLTYNNRQKRVARTQGKPVFAIYPDNTDEWFESGNAAARYFGIGSGSVFSCCQGNSHQSQGIIFEYAIEQGGK